MEWDGRLVFSSEPLLWSSINPFPRNISFFSPQIAAVPTRQTRPGNNAINHWELPPGKAIEFSSNLSKTSCSSIFVDAAGRALENLPYFVIVCVDFARIGVVSSERCAIGQVAWLRRRFSRYARFSVAITLCNWKLDVHLYGTPVYK